MLILSLFSMQLTIWKIKENLLNINTDLFYKLAQVISYFRFVEASWTCFCIHLLQ